MSSLPKKNHGPWNHKYPKFGSLPQHHRDFPLQHRYGTTNHNTIRVFSRRNRTHQEPLDPPWSRSSHGVSVSSSGESGHSRTADSLSRKASSPRSVKKELDYYPDEVYRKPRGGLIRINKESLLFRPPGFFPPPSPISVPFYLEKRVSQDGRLWHDSSWSSGVGDVSSSWSRDASVDEMEFCFGPAPIFNQPPLPFYRMIDSLRPDCLVSLGKLGFSVQDTDAAIEFQLSDQILQHFLRHQQTVGTFRRKLGIRDCLFRLLRDSGGPEYEKCGMYIVGSSLNGFATDNSDLDICLMVQVDEVSKEKALGLLGDVQASIDELAFHKGMELIATAKKPILRLRLKEEYGNIQVDLNANNPVTIHNTHLLHYYAQFDWRVRPLAMGVKEWASTIGINDSRSGTFTSYSLILLVIHFLQRTVPPVLPNLHQLYPRKFSGGVDVRVLSTDEPLDPHPPHLFLHNNIESLGSLFSGFLTYYAYFFKHHKDKLAVSIAHPHLGRNRVACPSDAPLFIEDPFSGMNTACAVFDRRIFERKIRRAFERSLEELYTGWSLASLFTWAQEFRNLTEKEDYPIPSQLSTTSPSLNTATIN